MDLPTVSDRGKRRCLLFIYKVLQGKLANYLTSQLNPKATGRHTRSQQCLSLEVPRVNTVLGNLAFTLFGLNKWNKLQEFSTSCNLQDLCWLIILDVFRCVLDEMGSSQCSFFGRFTNRRVCESAKPVRSLMFPIS